MAGDSLGVFIDYALATRPKLATSPDKLITQASKYRTHLFPRMYKGLTEDKIVQGGSKIIDFIQLGYTSSYGHYDAVDTFNFTGTNSLTPIEVPWRFSKVSSVTFEHEIDLQQGGEEVVYKRVAKAKESELELSWWEGMEDSIWATPNNEAMEAATKSGTGQPLSLRCFITDDGLAPSSTNGGIAAGSTAWTTVMTVNPLTQTNWQNQVATYDNTSLATREASFITAMDRLWHLVQFWAPDTIEDYNDNPMLNKLRIVMNLETRLMLIKVATARNNVLTPRTDIGYAAGKVVYQGIPTDYVGKLDLVDTGADTGTTAKYRARFINFNHFRPIKHSKHFRRARKFDGTAANPHAAVIFEDTWWNLWCQNRREQGIVRAA